MESIKRLAVLFLLCWSLPLLLTAQESPAGTTQDVVYLKDGSVYRGKIVEVGENRSITLELEGGPRIFFEASEIQKVVQEPLYTNTRRRKAPSELPVKGWNGDLLLGLNAARNEGDGLMPGISLHGRVGYQWKPWLGTGILFGMEKFAFRTFDRPEEILLPLMLDIHTYPFARDRRWYAAMGAGFTPAFLLASEGNASGGWTVFPRVGVRLPMQGETLFQLDIGYRVQQSVIESGWWGWGGGGNVTTRLLYQRFGVRLGYQFW